MKQVLLIGGLYGLILTAITLISNSLLAPGATLNWTSIGIVMLISIVILIVLGRKILRTDEIPSLGYGEALKYLFPAAILGLVLNMIVGTLLYQNNEEFKQAFVDFQAKSTESGMRLGMELAGADDASIEIQLEKNREQTIQQAKDAYPFEFAKLPLNILSSIFNGLFYALLASIFVKYKGSGV